MHKDTRSLTPMNRTDEPVSRHDGIGLDRVELCGETEGAIKDLKGFQRKYHTVPTSIDGYTRHFMAEVCRADLDAVAEQLHQALKEAYGYRRKEIHSQVVVPSAIIWTKDFEVVVDYRQHQEVPSRYGVLCRLANIRRPDALLTPGLQEIFRAHFNRIEFAVEGPVDVAHIIDAIEDDEAAAHLQLDYPPDASRLTLRVRDSLWGLELAAGRVTIVSEKLVSPRQLVDYFRQCRDLLAASDVWHLFFPELVD